MYMSKPVDGKHAPTDLPRSEFALVSGGVARTRAIGRLLARFLRPGDVVLLQGELGVGKTALAQGIARGLGITGRVTSPTFTLANEYQGRIPMYHLDLYRMEQPEEVLTFGFEEYFGGQGVVIVEWPERAAEFVPLEAVVVRLSDLGGNRREIRLAARGERSREILSEFRDAIRAEDRDRKA